MNQILAVIAVASSLSLAAPPQAGRTETSPPGWSAAIGKALDLTIAGKHLEVVSLYEQWVARHPTFAEAHLMLGAAHESVARAAIASRLPDASITRRKHLEAAVLHMRRGRALEGPRAPFLSLRALIDIHGVLGLNQPAEYERLVREGVARYPAEPLAHAYLLEFLAGKGESIDAAARAARAGIPKGPGARVDLAGALVSSVQDFGRLTPSLASALLPEASRLADEALALKPGDAAALNIQARITAMRTSNLPPADDAGVKGALRAIAMAQLTYSASCGSGYFAPSFAALSTPEPGKNLAFIAADYAPAKGAMDLEKHRYRITMTAAPSPASRASCNGVPAGGSARTFSVTARPLEGFHGISYRIDADGALTQIK
jgi:hypothetical protein